MKKLKGKIEITDVDGAWSKGCSGKFTFTLDKDCSEEDPNIEGEIIEVEI